MDCWLTRRWRRARKKRRSKIFVNVLIVLCLAMCAAVTLNALCEYRRLDMPMDSGALGVILGVWGGELLLIAARQVLGSDIGRAKENPCEYDENLDGEAVG